VLHRVVRLTTLLLVVPFAACSNAIDVTGVSHSAFAAQTVPVPMAPIIHISSINGMTLPNWQPIAMNDWGEIVGQYGSGLPFKWTGAHGYYVDSANFGGNFSCLANAVNNNGEMAVDCGQAPTVSLVDWFNHARPLRLLSTWEPPPGTKPEEVPGCTIWSVNDAGVAAGSCSIPFGPTFATVWTAYGTPDALFPPSSNTAIQGGAYGISNTGIMVGVDNQKNTGFIYGPNHQVTYLPPLGNSIAVHINDSSWAIGTIASTSEIVAWINDSLVDLGTTGTAIGVSNNGEIIGNSPTIGGFVWTRAHGLRYLPGVNNQGLSKAVAINNSEQIVTQQGMQFLVLTLPQGYGGATTTTLAAKQ
jgi:hypothetical protein